MPNGSGERAETAHPRTQGETQDPLLSVKGAQLSPEELAAVTSLLAKLASSEAPGNDGGAGTAGPADRTLQRRRRLGLWGRPGAGSWRHAAGMR